MGFASLDELQLLDHFLHVAVDRAA